MAARAVGKAVRLSESTHELLARAAKREGLSIAVLADRLILRGLDKAAALPDRARVGALRSPTRARRLEVEPGECRHPVTRRIGDFCALCGAPWPKR